MNNVKEFPKEAIAIRKAVNNRYHYLGLVYAMALFAAFQLSISAGWSVYISEAFHHMDTESGSLFRFGELIAQSVLTILIMGLLFFSRSAPIFVVFILYFGYSIFKMYQMHLRYADEKEEQQKIKSWSTELNIYGIPTGQYDRPWLMRLSKFETYSLILDIILFLSSFINALLSLAAVWWFTPFVIVKMVNSSQSEKLQQLVDKATKWSGNGSVVHSTNDNSKRIMSVAKQGDSFVTGVTSRKMTKAKVWGLANVSATTDSESYEGGSVQSGGNTVKSYSRKVSAADKKKSNKKRSK